jgi:geranylgeranyl reductase family protein
MPPHDTFDLIILGAGPAGSAAAVAARKRGLSVALIDKADFPRNKLCGGLITGRSMQYHAEIFGQPLTAPLIETRDRIAFYLDGIETGEMTDIPPLHLTMRFDFDDHLVGLARAAGATPFFGARVTEIDLERQRIVLQSGEILSYRALIGADGINSAVARALFGRPFDPDTVGFALEQELPPEAVPGAVRIDFAMAEYGYGWSFPKRNSTTFGVAGIHRLNPDMKGRYRAYSELCAHAPQPGLKGHFLPFGDYVKNPGRGPVLLAGDAAGLVDPITGEGIAYAMKSGALAGEAVAKALAGKAPEKAAQLYRRALAPIHRSLWLARLLRPAIFSRRTGRAFARSFADGGGRIKRAYLRMLAGELEYPDLIGLALLRLPKLVWRSLRGR